MAPFLIALFLAAGCRSSLKAKSSDRTTSAVETGEVVPPLAQPFSSEAAVEMTATSASEGVAWAGDPRAVSYEIFISEDAACEKVRYVLQTTEPKVILSSVADGSYYLCIRGITENHKILTPAGTPPKLVVDKDPPLPFVISSPAASSSTLTPRVMWSASEEGVEYHVVVAGNSCATPIHSGDTQSLEWTVPSALSDGTYVACVTAKDAVGHETAATNSPYTFTVDTIAPGAFTITTPPPAFTKSSEPSLTVNASAGSAFFRVYTATDAGCVNPAHEKKILSSQTGTMNPVNAGTFYACAESVDEAGNVTAATNNGALFSYFSAIALGQPSLNTKLPNHPATGPGSMNQGGAAWTDGTKMAVCDASNNRILIWNSMPRYSGAPADLVLGQPDMVSGAVNAGGSISASSLSGPLGIMFDGTHLVVADYGNHRVLIWNSWPAANQTPADVVVGQTALNVMVTPTINPTATLLKAPAGAWSDGTKLYIADDGYNRILIYNTFPTSHGAAANVVIGQPDMISKTANNGGRSASSIYDPSNVWTDGSKMVIGDSGNNRVLVFRPVPTTNGAAANLILGQSVVNGGTANSGGISASTLAYPIGTIVVGKKLFVAERENNRVLVWNDLDALLDNASPHGPAADTVYGQPDFISDAANHLGVATGFYWPQSVFATGDLLLVPELLNHRVKVIPLN